MQLYLRLLFLERLIPELKLVNLGVRHLPSHQSSTSSNLIYIWAKLKYNTLDTVPQVPLLNCCQLYGLITQLTSINTISFCFFLPPFFSFFFSWPARNLFIKSLRARLVEYFSNMFSVFKQHYTHFYTFFHPHIFQKNTNNITQTTLPNGPLDSHTRWLKMINLWKFPMTKGTHIQGMHYLISFVQMG